MTPHDTAASALAVAGQLLLVGASLSVLYFVWRADHPDARPVRWLRCVARFRGATHNPVRQPQLGGGFRCADCGDTAADLSEWGYMPSGYVKRWRGGQPEQGERR